MSCCVWGILLQQLQGWHARPRWGWTAAPPPRGQLPPQPWGVLLRPRVSLDWGTEGCGLPAWVRAPRRAVAGSLCLPPAAGVAGAASSPAGHWACSLWRQAAQTLGCGLVKAGLCPPETTSRAIVPAPSRSPGWCQGRRAEGASRMRVQGDGPRVACSPWPLWGLTWTPRLCPEAVSGRVRLWPVEARQWALEGSWGSHTLTCGPQDPTALGTQLAAANI